LELCDFSVYNCGPKKDQDDPDQKNGDVLKRKSVAVEGTIVEEEGEERIIIIIIIIITK